MSEFKAMKFRIGNDPELSEKVQNILFDIGYGWADRQSVAQRKESNYLYTEDDGRILKSETQDFFEKDDNEEINIDWMRTNRPETIELNGNTYIKAELEEALRHIKPV